MITKEEFDLINEDLNEHISDLANCRWGKIQNDENDKNTAPYKIKNFSELCEKINILNDFEKEYAKARFFRFKCAMADEYLFDINEGVSPNPDYRDKNWDFDLLGLKCDLKGTVIFKDMDAQNAIDNPGELIRRFYSDQSKGSRNNYQHRVFLVHHSFKNPNRIDYLRSAFDFKKMAIKEFIEACKNNNAHFFSLDSPTGEKIFATVLFILESEDGVLSFKY